MQRRAPFKAFTADVPIKLESQPNQQTFRLSSKFIPDSESDGIDPLTEAVSFQVGTFSTTVPAGCFRPNDGDFSSNGIIAGVALQLEIIQLDAWRFQFKAKGRGADLSGTEVPVKVRIKIGDDNGTMTLKNTQLIAGSHPLKLEPDDDAKLP